LDAIKSIRSLTALNILDCPQITEECKNLSGLISIIELYTFIEGKEGSRLRLLKASGFIYTDRIQELMQSLLLKEQQAALKKK
jgi:hypothetical protein